ncbi:MAG: adenylyl-sulfate kinase, partial [Planctomycetota bacterium]|nr:adenylyl-sulfate kinase [Planctomycetota bacterium]
QRAFELERQLWDAGHAAIVLDGQMLRAGLSKDLSFTEEDRSENLRRAAEFAKILMDQGFVVILSVAAPQAQARELARKLIGENQFLSFDCGAATLPDSQAILKLVQVRIEGSSAK